MYYHSPTNNYTGAKPADMSDFISVDGYPESRMLYVVNGSLPGPTLTVYPGQNITVHVINRLMDTAISMHFHGIVMMGTPFSDGVGFVTQCPIYPGQRFSHNFKISQPSGTYWYHGHVGMQRSMGMFGAFIIKRKPVPDSPDPEEHVLVLQDFNHDWDSEMVYFKMEYGMFRGIKKHGNTRSHDNGQFSLFPFHSGLINGRGRFRDPDKNYAHNNAPLAVFKVKKGNSYRFRVIAAGLLYPFRLSVDGHELIAVATDGFDVDPVPVESIIINPGERYDYMLEANQAAKNYLIRSVTLEVGVTHMAEATLNYEGVDASLEPTTSRRVCTAGKPCKVLNCPFKYFPKGSNIICISVDQLRGKYGDAPKADSSNYKQFFFNFAFPTSKQGWTPSSVNGRAFIHPPVSALSQMDEVKWGCDPKECGEEKVCSCLYHVDIGFGDTVQMVFLNMGSGKGWGHPIHLHGHSFYVVKQGFARYNTTTGKIIGDNLDVDCHGNLDRDKSLCNSATWADSTWVGDSIPGINLKRPPLKDTIIVPSSSYAVVRFKADNPGLWIMHCHIEMHNANGMSMLIREAKDRIPKPPKNFPTCRNFEYGGRYAVDGPKHTEKPEWKDKEDDGKYKGNGGGKAEPKSEEFNYRK
jgi:FtsP/CotA-like multicopper oxidase with cupredoxin domain